MSQSKGTGTLLGTLAAVVFLMTGCSHLPTGSGFNGGGGNAQMTLMFHDSPATGVTVTSFEVTITGVVAQPGSVSLLSSPQTIELTQLQTNSAFLSTNSIAANTYTSLTVTYSDPQYTILNDTGAMINLPGGQTCGTGQSCVIASPTETGALSVTYSGSPFPLVVGASQPTLLEVDVNLNNIVQSDYSLNFGSSIALSSGQLTSSQSTSPIDSFLQSGVVASTGSNTFSLTTTSGEQLQIPVDSNTVYEFQRANCVANDFTCLSVGQVVNVGINVLGDGTFLAAEVDFDDAASTQQVSGTIVGLTGTPPTSFQMVVHNTNPGLSGGPNGTPATVTIGNTATYVINNGSITLPGGVSFASAQDLMVGQEVEARVSGSFTAGPPATFTTDRIALELTQLTANVSALNSGSSSLTLNTLPALYSSSPSNPVLTLNVLTATGTSFEDLSSDDFGGLTVDTTVSVGGFLFNTPGVPTLAALTVRGQVPGT